MAENLEQPVEKVKAEQRAALEDQVDSSVRELRQLADRESQGDPQLQGALQRIVDAFEKGERDRLGQRP